MASATLLLLLFLPLLASCISLARSQNSTLFNENYQITWGGDHIRISDTQVVLSLDKDSGSGFESKDAFGSGYFQMRIKLPGKNTAGIVTAFYLTSGTNKNSELDFEFLGNVEGKPITLQTNVFAQGTGNREQRINLWFDPTTSFHDYKILWNPYQTVFYVDNVPIRVYANKVSKGVKYPTQNMKIIASLWNGEDWATDGGKSKIDWSYSPFSAFFQGFRVDGCSTNLQNDPRCSSSSIWWNSQRYQQLTPQEKIAYDRVKNKYMTYDYCDDSKRFQTTPPECFQ